MSVCEPGHRPQQPTPAAIGVVFDRLCKALEPPRPAPPAPPRPASARHLSSVLRCVMLEGDVRLDYMLRSSYCIRKESRQDCGEGRLRGRGRRGAVMYECWSEMTLCTYPSAYTCTHVDSDCHDHSVTRTCGRQVRMPWSKEAQQPRLMAGAGLMPRVHPARLPCRAQRACRRGRRRSATKSTDAALQHQPPLHAPQAKARAASQRTPQHAAPHVEEAHIVQDVAADRQHSSLQA